ncbi:OsmC family protein [Stenotrophomonas sp. YIM B06876]|uniref:OsmC family protein n=1 Tax=Stenotrophomonas sp. YIM B06876 TaxID=3060211 RepID=UPI002738801B|nr:OsmC family protein [Stenotrophomonas sp. YIM B06876]
MTTERLKASGYLKEGFKTDVKVREFSYTFDEPKNIGGTNEGMHGAEVLLAALAACMSATIKFFSKKFDVQLDELWVKTEGDYDLRGAMGVDGFRPGYSEIQYKLHIVSPSHQANIDRLIAYAKLHCPVADTIGNSAKVILDQIVVNGQKIGS